MKYTLYLISTFLLLVIPITLAVFQVGGWANKAPTINWVKVVLENLGDTKNVSLEINVTDPDANAERNYTYFNSYYTTTYIGDIAIIDISDVLSQAGYVYVNDTYAQTSSFPINFTISDNALVENSTYPHTPAIQAIEKNDTITNNEAMKSLRYNITHYTPPGGILQSGGNFTSTLPPDSTDILYSYWTGDWLNEVLGNWVQDTTKTMEINASNNATGYITREFNISNSQPFPFTGVDVTANITDRPGWTCLEKLTSVDVQPGDNQWPRAINCSKTNVVLGRQSSLTLYETEATVWTAYHPLNLTSYYNLTWNNTDNLVDYSVLFDSTEPTYWVNTTPSDLITTVPAGSTVTKRANFTLRDVYEDSYIETYQVGVGNKIKNIYTAYIKVVENDLAKTVPIRYRIPKARLTNWDSRLSDPAPISTINGSSANISIEGEVGTGYIDVVVGTEYGTSSLRKGTWEWQVIYYTPKSTSSGGGGGGGGETPTIKPILFEVNPYEFKYKLGVGIKYSTYLTVINMGDDPFKISLNIKGEKSIVSSNFTTGTIKGHENLTIPLFLKGYRTPVKKKAVIALEAKMGSTTSIKEIPVEIDTVELASKKIGETCYANEECESEICYKGKCNLEIEEETAQPKIKWYHYVIIVLVALVLLLLVKRKLRLRK